MTLFSKLKRSDAIVPSVCHRCRLRAGVIAIRPLSASEMTDGPDAWWLCEECAGTIPPNDPSSS